MGWRLGRKMDFVWEGWRFGGKDGGWVGKMEVGWKGWRRLGKVEVE